MKIIIGNWKSNKTTDEAVEWLEVVGSRIKRENPLDISIAPQFVTLTVLKEKINKNNYPLTLTAQNVSPFDGGTYTGEVWAKTLVKLVKYVLVGHSERRKNFAEDNRVVNLKVKMCHKYNLIPVVCLSDIVTKEGKIPVGEEFSFNENYFLRQIKSSVEGLTKEQVSKTLFMYEPPSAISRPIGPVGVGEAASIGEVLNMMEKIRAIIPEAKILYGGSVKSNNVLTYLSKEEIDGVVPGSASLNPEEFLKIIENALKI